MEEGSGDNCPSHSGLNTLDPSSLTTGDVHMFEALQIINEYVEKHFCTVLDKEMRELMFKEYPIPSTSIMKAPKVDGFMFYHLRSRFPKSNENQLCTIQTALLSATGPLNMLSEDSLVSAHDVLDVVLQTLVLLGNVNTLVTHTR